MTVRTTLAAALGIGLALATPHVADAFCGFYVAGGDQALFNDATQVVLMRKGTRTVLSMQNNYQGPPSQFAMVIPVPVVLKEADVKTLPRDVFAKVEAMGAPRLVEYWEQDPCNPHRDEDKMMFAPTATMARDESGPRGGAGLGVTVEAQFTVGEYQIVILSAKDSTGLDTWLRQEGYKIPPGAEPLLRPYVEAGSKFFVAKVDPTKVTFEGNRARLSPLRFHYDSEEFALPIRLGLANSSGTQDLIVNVLAPQQRYEVANYANVTIPTNIDVTPDVRDKFGAFYAALFDKTVEKNPRAVITEYAWQATTCDPCPGPALDQGDFLTLGADVLDGPGGQVAPYQNADFVLTRLHARYGKDITDDLRFKEVGPIVGGREMREGGKLEERSKPSDYNNFQGRYAIRYPWTGPIKCAKPERGQWGGPPSEIASRPGFQNQGTKAALDLAYAPRGALQLAAAVTTDVPEIGIRAQAGGTAGAPSTGSAGAGAAGTPPAPARSAPPAKKGGCGCQTTEPHGMLGGVVVVGAGLVLGRRRRRRAAGS